MGFWNKYERLLERQFEQSKELEALKREAAGQREIIDTLKESVIGRDKRIASLEVTVEAMKATLRPPALSADVIDEWINGEQDKGRRS